ncbi:MAG: type II toxin-antitoxin system HicB family antitoxin [Armatimonadota bacterium]|nr:type II toxin-antitoxin system HicB family antitoxin [Armatimonadota bacterium]
MKVFTALLTPEDDGYVAECLELDIVSQGDTKEEALANLKEAVEGFLSVASLSEIQHRFANSVSIAPFEVSSEVALA